MLELLRGLLVTYLILCSLVMFRELPGWLILPAVIGGFILVFAYIALDLRRVLRWRRIARRISE